MASSLFIISISPKKSLFNTRNKDGLRIAGAPSDGDGGDLGDFAAAAGFGDDAQGVHARRGGRGHLRADPHGVHLHHHVHRPERGHVPDVRVVERHRADIVAVLSHGGALVSPHLARSAALVVSDLNRLKGTASKIP